jgi:hypothetical protein
LTEATGGAALAETFCAILRNDGWDLERSGQGPSVVDTLFAGTTTTWRCIARVFPEQGQIVFDSVVPLKVEEDRRAEVAYLLTRVNWEILTGAFVLDAATGEIRFRNSLLVPELVALLPPVALGLVYANVVTVDRCLPELSHMLLGEASLGETLAQMGLQD